MSFQTSALLLSWVAILLLALVVAGLVRQVHALSRGVPQRTTLGPAPGTPAPAFDRLGAGLLLFLDLDCGVCTEVLGSAGELGRPFKAIFAEDGPTAVPPGVSVLTGERHGLFEAYGVPATPFAVIVDGDGRVRTAEPVGSPEALRELMELEVAR
ncbi:hypothetical protein J4573_43130 [Actinomadura barringtoniae]|uniref:Thioredoxin domain-containing protein n=1 Tax=Actinomadura barringtoniae TaxID=1427535 RepID=A0A939PJT5_9ACTN|nr:hypothetical protein [Actinomadura barringtoniae]MBO2453945.1 hypothetical protein [Actinomadura barringtoniae]